MHIDPWFLLAAANGTVSAAAVYFWRKANRWFLQSEYWRGCAGRASTDALNLHSELATLRHQNLIDAAKRREIARLGGKACQAKRAAADLAEAPARRAITTAALASTPARGAMKWWLA